VRLLFIGHTYTIRANQAKIAALAAMPDVSLTLVTPDRWKGPLYSNITDPYIATKGEAVEHHVLRSAFVGKDSAYFFRNKLFSIVAELRPDIVHVEQGAYALSYAQTILALKKFAPDARTTFFTWWNLPYRLTGFKGLLETFNLQHSSCAITGNAEAKSILICRGFKRPITVIPQIGVDPHTFELPHNEVLKSKLGLIGFVIGYVGRVTEEKGVMNLVEALGQMERKSDVSLYVVGDGPMLDRVIARAAKLGVRVVHTKAIRNEDVPQHLAVIDTLVLPSLTTEGWVEQFGHILIEAMAAGVPVIGSSSGEIPNVIQEGGRIYPEADTESLARILDHFQANPKLRNDLIAKGKLRVEREFTHQRIAEKQMKVYEWMMTSGKSVGELSARARENKRSGSIEGAL
jgi:glycosyltransferase involved in cell wall biosynthesis